MALDTQLTQIQSVGISSNTVLTGITTVTTLNATNVVVSGILTASLVGNVTGNTTGTHIGNVTGNLTGNVTGAVSGNVTGNVVGNVTAGSITINAANNTISGISTVGITTAYISNVQTNAIQTIAGKPILNSTGSILQVVQTIKTETWSQTIGDGSWSSNSPTFATFYDVTGLNASITLGSASNKILIMASVYTGGSANAWNHPWILKSNGSVLPIYGDTASSRQRCAMDWRMNDNTSPMADKRPVIINYLWSPGTTSTQTITIAGRGTTNSTIYVNRSGRDNDSQDDCRPASSLILMEISG